MQQAVRRDDACCRVALFSLEEYESAKAAFEKGQFIDPNNSSLKTWIRKCAAELDGKIECQNLPMSASFHAAYLSSPTLRLTHTHIPICYL